jgi:hypothetical protein
MLICRTARPFSLSDFVAYVFLTHTQLEEKVSPGVVNWTKVNRGPFKIFGQALVKKTENCNYAVAIAKLDNWYHDSTSINRDNLKLSVVGICGSDIYGGNKQLILAVVWQLMRAYTINLLNALSSTGGKKVDDAEIISFVNTTVPEIHIVNTHIVQLKAGKKSSSIASFKDPVISSSMPIIDLIDCIKPGVIDYCEFALFVWT